MTLKTNDSHTAKSIPHVFLRRNIGGWGTSLGRLVLRRFSGREGWSQGEGRSGFRFTNATGVAEWSKSVLTNRRALLRQSLRVSMTNSPFTHFEIPIRGGAASGMLR